MFPSFIPYCSAQTADEPIFPAGQDQELVNLNFLAHLPFSESTLTPPLDAMDLATNEEDITDLSLEAPIRNTSTLPVPNLLGSEDVDSDGDTIFSDFVAVLPTGEASKATISDPRDSELQVEEDSLQDAAPISLPSAAAPPTLSAISMDPADEDLNIIFDEPPRTQSSMDSFWFWFSGIFSAYNLTLFVSLWLDLCAHLDDLALRNPLASPYTLPAIKAIVFIVLTFPFLTFSGIGIVFICAVCYIAIPDSWHQASTSFSTQSQRVSELSAATTTNQRDIERLYRSVDRLRLTEEFLDDCTVNLEQRLKLLEQEVVHVQEQAAALERQSAALEELVTESQRQVEELRDQAAESGDHLLMLEDRTEGLANRQEEGHNAFEAFTAEAQVAMTTLVGDIRRLRSAVEDQESDMVVERQRFSNDMQLLAEQASVIATRYQARVTGARQIA